MVFCPGVYFSRRMAGWLPLGTILLTDHTLNFYYQSKGWNVWTWGVLRYQIINYLAYAAVIWLGKRYKPSSSTISLVGGGILGALLFYLITNTASWLLNPFANPEYSKTILGWITALIMGTKGWPQTWEFFRNTLLSGGLFASLFVAAMKLTAPVESPQDKVAGVRAGEPEAEAGETPEEAKA